MSMEFVVCNRCETSYRNFYHRFHDNERRLITFYEEHGLLCSTRACERCGHNLNIRIAAGHFLFQCDKRIGGKRCSWKISALKNTFFSNSKLSIFEIGLFIILWCNIPKPRLEYIKFELSLTGKTVTAWSSFCREVCEYWVQSHGKQIGGQGVVIEVDEDRFGRNKDNRNRAIGQWVLRGVERDNFGNFFVVPVESRDKDTLLAVITHWVLPGTIIVSDCWKSYNCLEDKGFVQLRVKHSIQFMHYARSGQISRVNKAAVHVKHGLVVPMGRKKASFQGYLAEFLFKSNYPINVRVHQFLRAAAELYVPLQ